MGAKKKRFVAGVLTEETVVCGPQWQIRMRKSPRRAGIEESNGHPVLRFALDGVTTFHFLALRARRLARPDQRRAGGRAGFVRRPCGRPEVGMGSFSLLSRESTCSVGI